jgi:hypothetical protein
MDAKELSVFEALLCAAKMPLKYYQCNTTINHVEKSSKANSLFLREHNQKQKIGI